VLLYAPLMRPARIGGGLRHLLPVALCALAGHLALYGSLIPSTGDHAYFVWYEPLVAGLSLVSLALLAGLFAAATIGGESLRRRAVSLLPPPAQPVSGSVRAVRLALASLAFLVCQETLERTLSEGRATHAVFGPAQLLLMLAAIALAATVVAVVERSCARLIEFVARPFARFRDAKPLCLFPPMRPLVVRRRNPLARLRGLRAPPLPV
jgi:hypothetical protein